MKAMRAFLFTLAVIVGSSAGAFGASPEIVYQIPWTDLRASDCSFVVDDGNVLLRCRNRIDILVKVVRSAK